MYRITLRQTTATRLQVSKTHVQVAAMSSRNIPGDDNPIHRAAEEIGKKMPTNPENPSIVSSSGAIGRQFNPDGNIGQIGEMIGGPFSSKGVIGKQFTASGGGIAGTVERMVDGPSQKKSGETKLGDKVSGMEKGGK
ncbi:hypothetical protein RUND412_006628 [Rhizina undulata]